MMTTVSGHGLNVSRRRMLVGAAVVATATLPAGPQAQAQAQVPAGPLSTIPMVLPKTEFVYEAIFDLDPTLMLGQGPLGERRMVPITGGVFEGPRIKGKVLPGGADRQLVRKDGVRMLDALYELQTDDGAVLTIHNKVLIHPRPDGTSYTFSKIDITAPEGPHNWLNQLVFVGTLHSLRPKPQVLIRVYSLA
jgi:Protein of unknown function (DUF3237)